MATVKHAIVRYIALDKCFSNPYKKFSFDCLMEVCNKAIYMEYGDDSGISVRTLREDIKFMRSDEGYNAPIEVMKDCGKPYYYRYSDADFSINKQEINSAEAEQIKSTIIMLSRFKGLPQFDWIDEVVPRLESSFNLRTGVEGVVSFEQNLELKGLSWFTDLFNAIVNKQVLNIEYRAGFGESREYVIHPYHLKQYNNRWFLFGLSIRANSTKIMNMALDRIEGFDNIADTYVENSQIDFSEYFDDVVGVTVPYNEESVNIKLKVDINRYNYIESKPLHHTQKELKLERGEDYAIIELKLIPNYEFKTLLLGFADGIEIVEPQSLREEIKERASEILKKNI